MAKVNIKTGVVTPVLLFADTVRLVCRQQGHTEIIDPATGKILWRVVETPQTIFSLLQARPASDRK